MIILAVVNDRRKDKPPYLLTLLANANAPTVALCLCLRTWSCVTQFKRPADDSISTDMMSSLSFPAFQGSPLLITANTAVEVPL